MQEVGDELVLRVFTNKIKQLRVAKSQLSNIKTYLESLLEESKTMSDTESRLVCRIVVKMFDILLSNDSVHSSNG